MGRMKLHQVIMDSLRGHFSAICESGIRRQGDLDESDTLGQVQVWQFMASLAVHATADQQRVLVSEVKEWVMEPIREAMRQPLSPDQEPQRYATLPVRIFLESVGLEPSQIAAII